MALELNEDFCGFTANYWVAEPHLDKINNVTRIYMLLFKDATARAAGAGPLRSDTFSDTFPWALAGTYKSGAEVYAAVKASHLEDAVERNKFVNAVDC